MNTSKKRIIVALASVLTIGLANSCKHEAGDICEGKNIGLNDSVLTSNLPNQQILDTNFNFTGQYYILLNGTITGQGKYPYTCYLTDSATKAKWGVSLKNNDTINNLDSGTYYIHVLDADSCSSPTYKISVP